MTLPIAAFIFAAVYALHRLSWRMFLLWVPVTLIIFWVVTSR